MRGLSGRCQIPISLWNNTVGQPSFSYYLVSQSLKCLETLEWPPRKVPYTRLCEETTVRLTSGFTKVQVCGKLCLGYTKVPYTRFCEAAVQWKQSFNYHLVSLGSKCWKINAGPMVKAPHPQLCHNALCGNSLSIDLSCRVEVCEGLCGERCGEWHVQDTVENPVGTPSFN